MALPSCLPTCSRERGHQKGCPVKAAEDAGVVFTEPSPAPPMESPPVSMPAHAPMPARRTSTPASERWGAAAAAVQAAQARVTWHEAQAGKARELLADALTEAHAAKDALLAEVQALVGVDA